MRHQKFEFTKDSAAKFWTVHLEDAAITIRFGQIGTRGQGQQKTLDSTALAEREYERLIREKVKKGYVETDADAFPNMGIPTKPAARSWTAKPKAPAGSSQPARNPEAPRSIR